MPERYRKIQCILKLLNNSLKPFLMTFANLLLLIVSFLLFGCICIWHTEPRSTLMFPLCSMRCGFEAITLLQVAGNLNQKSKQVLSNWKEVIHRNGGKNASGCIQGNRSNRERKWLELVHRSCPNITCTAGSMFTFEHSIVLVSLDNCFQTTLNLLVTFK